MGTCPARPPAAMKTSGGRSLRVPRTPGTGRASRAGGNYPLFRRRCVMFRWLAVFGVLCLSLLLVGEGVTGEKKKKRKKGVSGAVVSFEPIKDKDAYTLVVKSPKKKKKRGGDATEAKGHGLGVARGVKVEKAGRKRRPAEPATIEDIKAGVNVTVFASQDTDGKVERIVIQTRRKKKDKTD